MNSHVDPLRFEIEVALTPSKAFELFTGHLARWWPLSQFSIGQERAVACGFESYVGGHVWERREDGQRSIWGTVLVWEPPQRFAMTWHPGRPADTAQEVEVRFVPSARGTRVELEHRHWEALGSQAEETRQGYQQGWRHVFERLYFDYCQQSVNDASTA